MGSDCISHDRDLYCLVIVLGFGDDVLLPTLDSCPELSAADCLCLRIRKAHLLFEMSWKEEGSVLLCCQPIEEQIAVQVVNVNNSQTNTVNVTITGNSSPVSATPGTISKSTYIPSLCLVSNAAEHQ